MSGRESQVGGAQADGAIAHLLQRVGHERKLHLGLMTEAANLAPDINGGHRPAAPVQLLEKRVPPIQATFLILEARATAGFQVSVLSPADHQGQFWLRPADEVLGPSIARFGRLVVRRRDGGRLAGGYVRLLFGYGAGSTCGAVAVPPLTLAAGGRYVELPVSQPTVAASTIAAAPPMRQADAASSSS